MAECRQQIALFQPWVSTFENDMVQYNQELEDEYVERMSFLATLDAAVESTNWVMLGDPSKNRFCYPIDKRRTQEITATLQEAERALDRFWHKADIRLLHKNDTSPEALNKLLRSCRTLYRTPDWVEPSTTKTDRDLGDELEDLTRPLSEIYYDLQKRTEKILTPSEQAREKMKKKTRGTAKTPSAFTVDGRTLKAFHTLSFWPSHTAQPGEAPWNDFLHAMESAGFACEKLYGSVWQFTPSSLDVERSIQFHEPHPAGKIPFRRVRRFGRRLNRAYGWRGDIFCLQEA